MSPEPRSLSSTFLSGVIDMICFHSVLLGAPVVGEAESWKRVVYAKCKGKGGKNKSQLRAVYAK